MDIVTSYQKKIVASKNFIFISLLIVILIRIALFVFTDNLASYTNHDSSSPLSIFIANYISTNVFLSLVLSLFFTTLISFYCAYLNLKYSLIRVRTYLVYSIVFLIFSSHPLFLQMNSQYIEVLLFLLCIDILFSSYQQVFTSNKAYSIGFVMAIASLFSIYLLFYLILFVIGFFLMRSFNLKTFIALLLGVITVFWLVLFYYLWQKNFDEFIEIFTSISIKFGYYFDSIQLAENIILGWSIVFLILIIFNNLAYAYEDKIKVRAKIVFLDITAGYALISYSLINLDKMIDIYIYAVCFSILIAHFFAVSASKWKVYIFGVFLLSILISPFISNLFS